ncbi:MAG: sulfatase, partial [Verrucomicrobia bacterium]
MNPGSELRQFALQQQTRRAFLGRASQGVGMLALASLIHPALLRGATAKASANKDKWTGVVNPLHFPPKVKRIIWLSMAGGPSHLETFDPKPKLGEMHGKPMPESVTKGKQLAQLQGKELLCYGPQLKFRKFGKSGAEICELFEHIGSVVDDICIIRSMTTEAINHDPAHMFMNTGSQIAGRPSMGAWVIYGLGSDAQELPGFVVLTSLGKGGQNQPIAARQWASGLLPSRFQGVHLRSKGDPVLYLGAPPGVSREQQHDVVKAVNAINSKYEAIVDDPEISTRIAQYEMAFLMQASVPELIDTRKEPQHVLDLYGGKPGDGSFASNCLLARRLAERGVRFIQLYHKDWDHHGGVKEGITLKAQEVDRACMALISDLKQRGMLEDTL